MSSPKNPPRRLADLVRPHKVIVPEPLPPPAPRFVVPWRPNFIPEGWSWHPEDQISRPPLPTFDPTKIRLYRSTRQAGNDCITGEELRTELKGLPVLGADEREGLLANPRRIPAEWKGNNVFFWGTIYRDRYDHQCVQYLYWRGGYWGRSVYGLDLLWHAKDAAAILPL